MKFGAKEYWWPLLYPKFISHTKISNAQSIEKNYTNKKWNNNKIATAKKPKQYSIMYSEVSGVYTLYLTP